MSARTTMLPTQRVPAGDTGVLSVQLQNQDGDDLTIGQIDGVTISLWSELDGEAGIINNRQNQNGLNANQVAISASALLTWSWLSADMPFLRPERPLELERHVVRIVVTWGSGTGQHTIFQTFDVERSC